MIALPFYSQHLRSKMREPDEINIENIKNRKSSNQIEHDDEKQKRRIENKLKSDYKKDLSHEKIKEEIEKTLKELYGEKAATNYSNKY
jgi:hypothetical protein